ncbi:hypothetical protein DFS34DRAFT_594504 [Phlyctochytrium arcticum]|nr:hypothetical protein DFS34DRAFT_594504 [Phlyctochytrium arcticum]
MSQGTKRNCPPEASTRNRSAQERCLKDKAARGSRCISGSVQTEGRECRKGSDGKERKALVPKSAARSPLYYTPRGTVRAIVELLERKRAEEEKIASTKDLNDIDSDDRVQYDMQAYAGAENMNATGSDPGSMSEPDSGSVHNKRQIPVRGKVTFSASTDKKRMKPVSPGKSSIPHGRRQWTSSGKVHHEDAVFLDDRTISRTARSYADNRSSNPHRVFKHSDSFVQKPVNSKRMTDAWNTLCQRAKTPQDVVARRCVLEGLVQELGSQKHAENLKDLQKENSSKNATRTRLTPQADIDQKELPVDVPANPNVEGNDEPSLESVGPLPNGNATVDEESELFTPVSSPDRSATAERPERHVATPPGGISPSMQQFLKNLYSQRSRLSSFLRQPNLSIPNPSPSPTRMKVTANTSTQTIPSRFDPTIATSSSAVTSQPPSSSGLSQSDRQELANIGMQLESKLLEMIQQYNAFCTVMAGVTTLKNLNTDSVIQEEQALRQTEGSASAHGKAQSTDNNIVGLH